MEKIVEKICEFGVGDLVIIKPNQWEARASGTGIITEPGFKKKDKQSNMFQTCAVFNIKTSQIERIYLYNLELLSPTQ